MLLDFGYVAVGLLLLVFAGDALVRGAVALSLRLGISALVVSLTVVAFGTSAPELLVSVEATLTGATDLVFGNIVGSNIANVLLVLGIPALIAPVAVSQKGTRRNYVMVVAATLLFIAACGYGALYFWTGVAFLFLLCAFMFDAYLMATASAEPVELDDAEPDMPKGKLAANLIGGLIGLPIGATLLITGAQAVAVDLGVSEAVIGLTLVAVGTSLPELATTIMAAIRKQTDVAIGNVLGSNLFNILAVSGAAALFDELPTPAGFLDLDVWIMFAATLALAPFVILKRDVGKVFGLLFLGVYVVYLFAAFGPRI